MMVTEPCVGPGAQAVTNRLLATTARTSQIRFLTNALPARFRRCAALITIAALQKRIPRSLFRYESILFLSLYGVHHSNGVFLVLLGYCLRVANYFREFFFRDCPKRDRFWHTSPRIVRIGIPPARPLFVPPGSLYAPQH